MPANNKNRQPQAIIFDCFGVIITDALEQLMAPLRTSDPQKASQIAAIIGRSNRGGMSREDSNRLIAALLGMSVGELIAKTKDNEVKDTELLSYIQTLRPTYKTALLSNVSREGFWRRFTPKEVAAYFDAIIISGEIGFAKPEPQAYETAADKLGVRAEDCIMIDDRQEYCDGARQVGMRAILYQSFEQMKQKLAPIL